MIFLNSHILTIIPDAERTLPLNFLDNLEGCSEKLIEFWLPSKCQTLTVL